MKNRNGPYIFVRMGCDFYMKNENSSDSMRDKTGLDFASYQVPVRSVLFEFVPVLLHTPGTWIPVPEVTPNWYMIVGELGWRGETANHLSEIARNLVSQMYRVPVLLSILPEVRVGIVCAQPVASSPATIIEVAHVPLHTVPHVGQIRSTAKAVDRLDPPLMTCCTGSVHIQPSKHALYVDHADRPGPTRQHELRDPVS